MTDSALPLANIAKWRSKFALDGFVVVQNAFSTEEIHELTGIAHQQLADPVGPLEFEVDLGYRGAPSSKKDVGGQTPRRLLRAFDRDVRFQKLARHAKIKQLAQVLLDSGQVVCNPNHHNCIMTKHHKYSSSTPWHQDIRYWRFRRAELVTAWIALGVEGEANGGLHVIPGSHRLLSSEYKLAPDGRLEMNDPGNQRIATKAEQVMLKPGELLMFHCKLFHRAGLNRTSADKLSLVFTYHAADNAPIPGTRSAELPPIEI